MASRDDPEDDNPRPVSGSCDGEGHCCGEDHQEEDVVSGEVESHCGGGCCADGEEDCESSVDNCKDSCCGHDEDHGIAEEAVCDDPRGAYHTSSCVGGSHLADGLTPHQICVSVQADRINPSRTIRVAASPPRAGRKRRARRLGSASPTEFTDADGRLCSSRPVADPKPIPSQVPPLRSSSMRDYSRASCYRNPFGNTPRWSWVLNGLLDRRDLIEGTQVNHSRTLHSSSVFRSSIYIWRRRD